MRPEPQLRFETPERVALSLELAGLGERAFAYLADLLCIFLLWVTALLVHSISGDLLRDVQALSFAGQLLAVLGVLLSGWGWDVAWETLGGGRTPGKRLLGIRVVRADGAPVGAPESIARNALRAVEVPLAYAPGVLAVALTPRRQRLGDLVAGTLVVRERRYDLSRYGRLAPGAPAGGPGAGTGAPDAASAAASRLGVPPERVVALLGHEGFERLADFLRRRPGLEPGARARVAARLAAALAARAGASSPAPGEAEAFLEALHQAAGGEGA